MTLAIQVYWLVFNECKKHFFGVRFRTTKAQLRCFAKKLLDSKPFCGRNSTGCMAIATQYWLAIVIIRVFNPARLFCQPALCAVLREYQARSFFDFDRTDLTKS